MRQVFAMGLEYPRHARNGIPSAFSRAFPSASVRAVVQITTVRPLILSTLSRLISGKITCSRMPSEKLPRPSKARSGTPLKSRTRGSATFTSRSKNSYIRAPRSVTIAPMGVPSRSLKLEIALRARVTTGRCPVIAASSSTAESSTFGFCVASPSPMLSTIFSSRGTASGFVLPRSRARAGTISRPQLPRRSRGCSSRRVPTRVGLLQRPQMGSTFDAWIDASFSTMPPGLCTPRGFVCRFTRFTCSMTTRSRSGRTRSTLPVLPRSRPAITITVSSLRSRWSAMLEHLGRERDDLHEPLGAQLPGDRAEDAGADRLARVVDEHRGVRVEADVGAVGAAHLFRGADDHRPGYVALLHLRVRNRLLHRDHDHVADRGVLPPRAAEHLDAQHLAGAAVVGDVEDGLRLDHAGTSPPATGSPAPSCRERIAWTAQRLSCERGRVSTIRTRSPTRQRFCSSCAL